MLRLHHIPKSRGLFVTTSTDTPRATTIGITCIDGAGLERLEKTATTALIIKYMIILGAAAGGYGLYYYRGCDIVRLMRSAAHRLEEGKDVEGEHG